MKTATRTAETPYCAIDPMTQEYLGWYDTYTAAQAAHSEAFIYYRPSKRKAKK